MFDFTFSLNNHYVHKVLTYHQRIAVTLNNVLSYNKILNYDENLKKNIKIINVSYRIIKIANKNKQSSFKNFNKRYANSQNIYLLLHVSFSYQKVLQYKNRCTELELITEQYKTDMERLRHSVSIRKKHVK